ncbi:MAG: ribbon-helix-helix protein, CopG family [Cyclobacteriaceae bacterium]|jgi:predicted transcriptional regulator
MKNRNSEKILKAVRMDADMVDRIQEMAEKQNRNFSNMVKTILRESLNNESSQSRRHQAT